MDGKTLIRLALFFILVGLGQLAFIRSLWKSYDKGAAKKRSDPEKKGTRITAVKAVKERSNTAWIGRIFTDLLKFFRSVKV